MEIANQLGVSRSLIATYLQRAREQQLVRIEIVDPRDDSANLALKLRQTYNIEKAILVPFGHKSDELTRRAVAAEVAQLIESQIKDGDVLGIGWGRTTSRMLDLLAPNQAVSVDVAPLLGESNQKSSYSQMNHMILRTAQHFGGRPHFLLAPMVVGSPELRDMLWRDMVVNEVAAQWDRMTIACFGIGVEQLHGTPCRIAIASGIKKANAVIGALRTGLITHLVVDTRLAAAIMPSA